LVWSFTDSIQVRELEDGLEITAPLRSSVGERALAMQKFFQKKARAELPLRLEFWSRRMGLQPSKVSIRGQSTRWGSCSGRGEIALNWKLLCAPSAVVDYVIVHELAHLQHMNHSPRFWALVAEILPSYRDLKLWLRGHENEINWIWRPETAPAL
jgi:predicted metal-dependent hydrolase